MRLDSQKNQQPTSEKFHAYGSQIGTFAQPEHADGDEVGNADDDAGENTAIDATVSSDLGPGHRCRQLRQHRGQ